MVIQTSQVSMASKYQKTTYEAASVSYTGWGDSGGTANFLDAVPTATDGAQMKGFKKTGTSNAEEVYDRYANSSGRRILDGSSEESVEQWSVQNLTEAQSLELSSLTNLMETFSTQLEVKLIPVETLFQRLMERLRERLQAMMSGHGGSIRNAQRARAPFAYRTGEIAVASPNMERVVEETTFTNLSATKQSTRFQSTGTVVTADGREIEFDLSFSMSQSFLEYTEVTVDYKKVMMVDPLVVNLSGTTADLSDQEFLFDLDADGTEDNISLLGEMCGFLALDRNADGKINDGSELFGAKTGDGFQELAVFDLDGNGWIDENDEVFNHLKIWRKDEAGKDHLVALGIQGIGAIYLGNVSTAYELRQQSTDETNGMLQKSGIYLNEDGSAGTIQHVDFALK